jgi:hypothetical protein
MMRLIVPGGRTNNHTALSLSTTNLGVGSSNLSGRAKKALKTHNNQALSEAGPYLEIASNK